MITCSKCHHPNPPDSRFCGRCGTTLVSAEERREERKIISVLFADLVGFTSRAEHMDVEDVRAMLAPFYALVRERLEQNGGTVEKFIGDAVMAVFGAPVAREDDPERAVRAALGIREAVAASNERHPELDLHVRVAVNTGEALVALDANPAAGEIIASGDVVNTAARLQSAAPIDGVVVGIDTYQATCDVIEYDESFTVTAKGKAEPVRCWPALRARSRIGETRRRQDATPLIGRQPERRALIDAFEHVVRTRSVRALTLVGVPGIGKSRLVRELFRHIDEQPELVRWREGRSPPYGDSGSFWALGEIVKAEAGLLDSHEASAAASNLAKAVATVAADREEAEWVERHLRALVGLEGDTTLFGDRRAEAFAAWRRFVERLAEKRPTVLVFEDLHWADDDAIDFVEHLVAWAADVPLLVVCTGRPELLERRPRWGAETETTRVVSLSPLTESETRDFLDALLPNALLPEKTRSALLATAEGNPLYAQEFVRMLMDRDLLVQRGGEWVLEQTEDFPVPDSVHGIVSARLDSLPETDKAVIQDAAVVGRLFWVGAVAAVSERGRWAIEEALRQLEHRQLVRRRHESAVAGDSEWVFEHALIRDVAYRTIVRRLRAEKHERAAVWMSSLSGARRDRADAIAYHYVTALEHADAVGTSTSELREAALGALQAAAERAMSIHSHTEAVRLWGQALELCAPEHTLRPRLLLEYGKALALADEPAAKILDEASAALVAAGDLAGAAEAESTNGWLLSLAGNDGPGSRAGRAGARARERRAALVRQGADPHARGQQRRPGPDHACRGPAPAGGGAGNRRAARAARDPGRGAAVRRAHSARRGRDGGDPGQREGARGRSRTELTGLAQLLRQSRRLSQVPRLAARTPPRLHLAGERAAERFGIPVQVRRFRAEQAIDLYYDGRLGPGAGASRGVPRRSPDRLSRIAGSERPGSTEVASALRAEPTRRARYGRAGGSRVRPRDRRVMGPLPRAGVPCTSGCRVGTGPGARRAWPSSSLRWRPGNRSGGPPHFPMCLQSLARSIGRSSGRCSTPHARRRAGTTPRAR